MRTVLRLALCGTLAAATVGASQARPLDIYFIDVEGGASTLVVTPAGESMLMDAGYAGLGDRDPARIERVAKEEAGLSRIDYLLTSHFHPDHVGGLASVAKRFEVGAFIDHGDSVEVGTAAGKKTFDDYLAVAGRKRRVVVPGDTVALKGVDVTIVTSNGKVLARPINGGGANPLCDTFKAQPVDAGENARSLGYLLSMGSFQFANLGDISWNVQHLLACPANLLGTVDLFQATHHAVRDDVLPQQMWAMAPLATIMNNGPAKGAGAAAIDYILKSPGPSDLWSLHTLLANDAAHNAVEARTANLGPSESCEGHWIRVRVQADGTFTVSNHRNGESKTYRAR